MKKTFLLTLALLAIISFSANAQNWGSGSASLSSSSKTGVSWDKMEIDMGEVKQNNPQDAVFNMTNNENRPVFITKAVGSCGCTHVEYPKRPIKPGETVKIRTVYDAEDLGVFNKTVTLTLNIEESTQVLKLNGVVR